MRKSVAFLSADVRTTLRAARQIVLARGQAQIDSVALVEAMLADPTTIAGRALAGCVISAGDFAALTNPARVPALVPAGPAQSSGGSNNVLSDDARTVINSLEPELRRRGDDRLTSGDLLLAICDDEGAPAAMALAALGVTPELLRPAVLAGRLAMVEPSLTDVTSTVPLPAPPPGMLPRRAGALVSIGLLLLAYGVALALAAATVPDPIDRAGLVFVFLAVVAIDVPLIEALRGLSTRRLARRLAIHAPTVVTLPPLAYDLVGRYGVTQLETRVQLSRRIRDRAYRVGQRAWVVLSAITVRSGERLPFVLGHELGHVLRNDSRRRRVSLVAAVATVAAAASAGGPVTVLVATAAGGLIWVGEKWVSEYAADAIAVRWVGIQPLRTWLGAHQGMLSQPQNRTPRRRLARALGLLTHPPLSWRLRRAQWVTRSTIVHKGQS